jgi:RHS repeat-associated protein
MGTSCGTSPLYLENRTYDSVGRLSTRAITQSGNPGNDPGGVFLFRYEYNALGFLNTLTYPISTSGVALNVLYGYAWGLLSSVADTTDTTSTCGSTCTLWTANAMNAFGQINKETFGNGVVLNRTYDPVTSWLTAATGGVGGGSALVNQSYLQDQNGNVIQRQANNPGLTESYSYDADNRLTCVDLASSCSTPVFLYDAAAAGPGNITSQTGVGTYTYPAAGQPRPHAVTSIAGTFNGISNPSFSYDANGNMTGRAASANITWSSYNYPTAISANDATGNEEVQLLYGPDRQRWEQIYTVSGTTEKTYYIGGLIDLIFSGGTTNYRHYIYAGSEPIALYSRTAAGVNTMSYMYGDSRSSVAIIANNAGVSDIGEAYTAYGARRNQDTWSGAPTTATLNTIASLSRQGFTFQTALGQSMGLNHMNGRVQDAILGRFLSPDPHIPDPGDAQSYNRYSYVLNNPLTRIDPSGFADLTPLPDDGPAETGPEIDVTCCTPMNSLSPFPGGLLGSMAAAGSAAINGPVKASTEPNPTANANTNQTTDEIVVTATVPNAAGFASLGSLPQSQNPNSVLCKSLSTASGAISGAVGGVTFAAFTGQVNPVELGAAAVAGAAVGGYVAFQAPNGGLSGGVAAALASLAVHANGGTTAEGFAGVFGDTAAGAFSSPAAAIPVGAVGGGLYGAVGTAGALGGAGIGGGALVGATAGGIAAAATLGTNLFLNGLSSRIFGCP